MNDAKTLLTAEDFQRTIRDIAARIVEASGDPSQVALIGVRTRGATLAERLREVLQAEHDWDVPLGVLDITLYRDDLSQLSSQPVIRPTEIGFNVEGRTIFLVDDVLYTGRTIRCALQELTDIGRARAIRLVVLVDRGLREMPIQADVAGLTVQTAPGERVEVRTREDDGEDAVRLLAPPSGGA